jgi:hypothetical protein
MPIVQQFVGKYVIWYEAGFVVRIMLTERIRDNATLTVRNPKLIVNTDVRLMWKGDDNASLDIDFKNNTSHVYYSSDTLGNIDTEVPVDVFTAFKNLVNASPVNASPVNASPVNASPVTNSSGGRRRNRRKTNRKRKTHHKRKTHSRR